MSDTDQTGRCYCKKQNDLTNLNDIINTITILNSKILRLRNEVSALNSVNDKKKLFKKPDVTRKKKLDNVKHESMILQLPASAVFESDPTENKINVVNKNETSIKTSQTNRQNHEGVETPRKIRKKKISKGVQCDRIMERRKKRLSLNCFKIEKNINDPLKQRKRRKISKANVHVTFDPRLDNREENASIKIKPKIKKEMMNSFEKFSENKLEKNVKSRLGGGAEFRGNRGLFDFNDKVLRINLYKSAKVDAQNVRRRLDACIVELNEIIEDVSLIFPDKNTKKELGK